MSEEWEKVEKVPLGTVVRIKNLSIHFVCTGERKDIRNGYGLDYNFPALDGLWDRLTVNSKKTLVHRVPLLSKP